MKQIILRLEQRDPRISMCASQSGAPGEKPKSGFGVPVDILC